MLESALIPGGACLAARRDPTASNLCSKGEGATSFLMNKEQGETNLHCIYPPAIICIARSFPNIIIFSAYKHVNSNIIKQLEIIGFFCLKL
jgi:hypothetical protein